MKINSKIHGIIDYLLVLFLWLSPSLFGLPPTTSGFVYGLGVVYLSLSVCTHYEFGLVRFIPLKVHGYVELVISLFLVPITFYVDSTEGELARNYVGGLTIAVFIVWLLSDFTNKPDETREIPFVESNTDGGMI
ncbi:MAG TPA: hypothetical protein VFM79_00745 [Pelobium sp.]|nr:hypothetical protein [Pelobium sp.]